MLDFMIIGLPRSATTWAANFFTTDTSLCLHDPLYRFHYSALDGLAESRNKLLGISCTGIWRFPKFVNAHPARKIILRRSLAEVNAELAAIGLPGMDDDDLMKISGINGEHFHFSDLFNPFYARQMCEFIGLPFDTDRHAELKAIQMQPNFGNLEINPGVTRRLVAELQEAMQ